MSVSLNDPNYSASSSVQLFTQFYGTDLIVNADEYDLVIGYMRSVCSTDLIAQNLTTAIFKIANETGISIQALLDEIQGQKKLQLSATLSYFLNMIRSSSSYLAVGEPITPQIYAARNVHI
jgi:hypothetical protein